MTTDGTAAERGTEDSRHVIGDLVVDSDHASLVLELLPPRMARVTDAIPALGLSLVTFDDVRSAIDALPEPTSPLNEPGADLMDRLIAALRSAAAFRWSRWYPAMGKNRIVMRPEGEPYVSPKDDPEEGPKPDPTPLSRAPGVNPDDGVGVVVGVLDTAAILHPFYADSVRFIGDSETTSAQVEEAWQAHGTFVTGLVHANAPGAQILVRAVLSRDKGVATAWEAAKGLVNLVQAGADVINMSIGCTTKDNQPPFAMRAAVDRLRDRTLFVAAAGNYDGPKTGGTQGTPPSWPAALDGVVAVGSEDSRGVRSWFSPDEPWVDLVTNGREVPSAFVHDQKVRYQLRNGTTVHNTFNGAAIWSGTSFAAAAVSGRIASLASRSGYPYTGTTPRALAKELRDAGHPADGIARRPARHH